MAMDIRNTVLQRIERELGTLSPRIRDAFLEAMSRAASQVNLADLAEALERGDVFRASAMLQINEATLYPVTEAIRQGYINAGVAVANDLPLKIRATFGFGGNLRAVQAVKEITGEFITHIIEAQREATREVVTALVNEGIPARRAALSIVGKINPATGLREGGFIGLDVPRAGQASKVATILRDPERIREYFVKDRVTGKWKPRFTTTDRRFDKRVRDAINSGQSLSQDDADQITKAHRSRLMKNRADVIARNEGINAMRAGEHDGWQQMVDSGAVAESRIERAWLAAHDSHTRIDHVAMQGQKVRGMSQPFTFPGGSQAMFPGDASRAAPPEELINCRCVEIVRIKRPGAL